MGGSSGEVALQGVDFPGVGVAHEEQIVLGRNAEPGIPRPDHTAQILQAHNSLGFLLGKTDAVDCEIGVKAVIKVDEFAVGGPFEMTDSGLCELRPFLRGEIKE